MKEFGKDNFNRAIKAKFKDSTFEPSGKVWEGIETELLRVENAKMQKRALWYRNLAASVILVALVSIYFNVIDSFNLKNENSQFTQIDLRQDDYISFRSQGENIVLPQFDSKMESYYFKNNVGDKITANGSSNKYLTTESASFTNNSRKTNIIDNNLATGLPINIDEPKKNNLSLLSKLTPNTATQSSFLITDNLEKVSYFAISEVVEKPKEENGMNFIADLSFGSGTFNPNATVTGNSIESNAIVSNAASLSGRNSEGYNYERAAVQELSSAPMQSNLSVSYGLSFGVNLSERLLLKSGIQYGNYRSTSESSAVVRDVNSDQLYPFHGASSTARVSEGKVVNITSPYNLYNDFEILSVPLQFTYNLLKSRLGVGLTAGITTDFLISNTITGASDQINAIKFTQNDSKSYKDVFASSMVGIDLTYAIGDHYGLSLSPQYKKALTDVTNSNTNFKSSPAFASINMSFQYIF